MITGKAGESRVSPAAQVIMVAAKMICAAAPRPRGLPAITAAKVAAQPAAVRAAPVTRGRPASHRGANGWAPRTARAACQECAGSRAQAAAREWPLSRLDVTAEVLSLSSCSYLSLRLLNARIVPAGGLCGFTGLF